MSTDGLVPVEPFRLRSAPLECQPPICPPIEPLGRPPPLPPRPKRDDAFWFVLPCAISVVLALLLTKLRSSGTITGAGVADADGAGRATVSVVWA